MTRYISDFNQEMKDKGYTLHAIFTYNKRGDGFTTLEVIHFWKYKEGVSNCYPAAAVKYFNAPKKVEKWLSDYWKLYWTHEMTNEDIETFFKIWEKRMRACGLDPDDIVQIDGSDDM